MAPTTALITEQTAVLTSVSEGTPGRFSSARFPYIARR
jgi:hypothetical protein